MRYVLPVFITLWLMPFGLFSQLDTVHYIPPLHSRKATHIGSHYLYISSPSTTDFQVTIEDGGGNVLLSTNVSPNAPYIYNVGNAQDNSSKCFVPNDKLNTVLTSKGIKLHATVPCYVSFRVKSDYHAECLTSKGTAALGNEFRFGGFPQFTDNNGEVHLDRNFTAGIMATEDNTTVTINDYDPDIVFAGSPSSSANSITVSLNEGECYVVAGNNNIIANQNGFMGAHIVSNKPIALNNGNLIGNIHSDQSTRDMGIDQSVPVDRLGSKYVVIEGGGPSTMEIPIIIANYDSTDVFINGDSIPITTLDAGDYYLVSNSYYSGVNHKNMYIETTKDVYLYQALSGGGFTTTGGLNFIPPLSCFLPDTIKYIPQINKIGSTLYTGGIMVFTNEGADFKINGVVQTGAEPVPSAPWETFKVMGLQGDVTLTSSQTLAVGMYGFSGNAGFAGYYSGFSAMPTISEFTHTESCPGLTTDFSASIDSSAYIDSVIWDFGDPSSGALNNSLSGSPSHLYTIPGQYIVQMIVYRCVNDTVEHTVTIQDISVSPISDQFFCPELNSANISFSIGDPEISYTWTNDNTDIGLGSGSIGDIPSFIAPDPGAEPLVSNIVVTPESNGCFGETYSFLITINPIANSSTDLTICDTELPYTWNGLIFSGTDSQTALLTSSVSGCDSLATLNLTVNAIDLGTTDITICESQLPFIWNGLIFNAGGSQTAALTNTITGCDYFATLNLTVTPALTNSVDITICASSFPYTWNGLVFSAGGSQTALLTSLVTGCDSLVTLNLTVTPNVFSTTEITICENQLPYTWNGLTFSNEGAQTATLTSMVSGCDSLATLELITQSTLYSSTDTTVCTNALPFDWNGLTFTGSSVQTTSLTSYSGCDSVVTLFVYTIESSNAAFSVSSNSISESNCAIYFFNETSGPADFIWNYGDGNISVDFEGLYKYDLPLEQNYMVTLKAISSEGCVDSTSMEIFYKAPDDGVYYVPNSFTPDSDEYNPVFKAIFADGFYPLNFEVSIYNRWGELVFKSNDIDVGWDGTSGLNSKAMPGTYTWNIFFTNPITNENTISIGHVNLIK
mgnify:CR=1 FL=1